MLKGDLSRSTPTSMNSTAPTKWDLLNENLSPTHGLPTYELLVTEAPGTFKNIAFGYSPQLNGKLFF